MSTECPFAFVRPEDLRPSASKDPLSQGGARMASLASDRAAPDGPEAGSASSARAGPARTGAPSFFFASDVNAEATHRVF